VSVYFNFFQQDLYNQYFEIYPNVYQPVVRGSSEESTKAFMYYENKDYDKAQRAFLSLLEEENNPNIRFYYALSLLNDNLPEKGLEELKKLQNIQFEFQAEVLWYSALTNLKIENNLEAKKLLNTLKSKFPEYMPTDVKQLIDDLN
jgi:tetratricopeptide (TPR) repeat protein